MADCRDVSKLNVIISSGETNFSCQLTNNPSARQPMALFTVRGENVMTNILSIRADFLGYKVEIHSPLKVTILLKTEA